MDITKLVILATSAVNRVNRFPNTTVCTCLLLILQIQLPQILFLLDFDRVATGLLLPISAIPDQYPGWTAIYVFRLRWKKDSKTDM